MKRLKRLSRWRNSSGFTLVEVIVSTALLGVLIIGILLFMTPVFSLAGSSETNTKANRFATTMELYVSKSLRSSVYIKVYTGAEIGDITSTSGAIYTDADFQSMKDFVIANSENYELRCMSIRYVEDTNPRNSSVGDTAYKYMLYNDKIDTAKYFIDKNKSELVFDECFYEDIYPKFSFAVKPVYFDENGAVIDATAPDIEFDTEGKPKTAKLTLYPAVEMNIDIYEEEGMGDYSRVFKGLSYIEANNIKSLQLNSKGTYKIYQPMEVTDGTTNKDTYIFYVARKAGVLVGSSTTASSTT